MTNSLRENWFRLNLHRRLVFESHNLTNCLESLTWYMCNVDVDQFSWKRRHWPWANMKERNYNLEHSLYLKVSPVRVQLLMNEPKNVDTIYLHCAGKTPVPPPLENSYEHVSQSWQLNKIYGWYHGILQCYMYKSKAVYVLVLEDVTQVLGQVCNYHTHNFNTTWVEPMSLHNIDQCFCCWGMEGHKKCHMKT